MLLALDTFRVFENPNPYKRSYNFGGTAPVGGDWVTLAGYWFTLDAAFVREVDAWS